MKKLKKSLPILEYLVSLTPSDQKKFISTANREILQVFTSICINIIKKGVPLTEDHIKKLRKIEPQIILLANKSHSQRKKREIIARGGFVGTLLSTLLPVLVSGILSST